MRIEGRIELRARPWAHRAAEESLRELFQAVVPVFLRLEEKALHLGEQRRVPPVIAGGRLGADGVSLVRSTEQRPGRRQVVAGVGPVGEGVSGGVLAASVFIDERA